MIIYQADIKYILSQIQTNRREKKNEQVLINEQGEFFPLFFKRADPKKCVQGWEKIQKC